jgi:hypothetical protein
VNPSGSPEIMTAYSDYMTNAAKAIRDNMATGATDAQIDADVLATWNFESELAKVKSLSSKYILTINYKSLIIHIMN